MSFLLATSNSLLSLEMMKLCADLPYHSHADEIHQICRTLCHITVHSMTWCPSGRAATLRRHSCCIWMSQTPSPDQQWRCHLHWTSGWQAPDPGGLVLSQQALRLSRTRPWQWWGAPCCRWWCTSCPLCGAGAAPPSAAAAGSARRSWWPAAWADEPRRALWPTR